MRWSGRPCSWSGRGRSSGVLGYKDSSPVRNNQERLREFRPKIGVYTCTSDQKRLFEGDVLAWGCSERPGKGDEERGDDETIINY